MDLKINSKLLLYIMTTATLIYVVAIGYIIINFRSMSVINAERLTDAYASRYANIAKAHLSEDMAVVRSTAQAFQGFKTVPQHQRITFYREILKQLYLQNPQYLATWANWEYRAIDSTYKKPYGRLRLEVTRQNGQLRLGVDDLNMEGDKPESQYYKIKIAPYNEWIVEPYFYSYNNGANDSVLETSCAVPIWADNGFIGMVGIDVPLKRFQDITNNIKPYEKSYAFFLSNQGKFVAHPLKENINKNIVDLFPEDNKKFKFGEKIKNGEPVSFVRTNPDGTKSYVSFAPLTIGKSTTPWSIGIVVPLDVILKEANQNVIITITVAVIGFIILAVVIIFISQNISKPLIKISSILKDMAKGIIDESMRMRVKSTDEIGQIRESVNTLIDGLKRTTRFAHQIGEGNLNANYTMLSDQDMLGASLLEMRTSLQKASLEDAKRKEEDQRQHWATEGQARFGDVLRENQGNLESFSYGIISYIVKYIEADQGGLFLVNHNDENNVFIELTGSFAYSGEKMLNKKLVIGENLVGIAVKLGEVIHLNNIPENYIKTSSGLGAYKPNNLLIVPLKHNQQIFGAVELASFKVFQDYQISFVERVGDNIASTISNIQLNIKTIQLLEDSKIKSDELVEKENTLRKNIDELTFAQREAAKREAEMQNVLDAIDAISMVAEYDMEGRLIKINDRLQEFFNVTREEIIGRYQGSFSVEQPDFEKSDDFKKFWNDLRNGQSKQITQHVSIEGKKVYIQETYTPIFDAQGQPFKVLNLAVDVTEKVLMAQQNESFKSSRILYDAKKYHDEDFLIP